MNLSLQDFFNNKKIEKDILWIFNYNEETHNFQENFFINGKKHYITLVNRTWADGWRKGSTPIKPCN